MTLDERIAKRKAEGWEVGCWVVKLPNGTYLNRSHTGWTDAVSADRFRNSANAVRVVETIQHKGAYASPIFTRTTKLKRGHGFGWALARMKEGKRVRRASWENPRDSFGIDPEGEIIFGRHMNTLSVLDASHILATNWELAE
ncbi:hypothetical protein K0U83_12095 [bacterium]|nr:hypothetical protein [bacterium]